MKISTRLTLVVALFCALTTLVRAQHSLQIDNGLGAITIITGSSTGGTYTFPPGGGTILTAPAPGSPSLAWLTAGNGNTTPGIGAGQHYLGTSDAKDLVIAANATERMRISNITGYVGIGTGVGPNAQLHVNGGVSATIQTYGDMIVQHSNAGALGGALTISNTAAAATGNAAALAFNVDNTSTFTAGGAVQANAEIRAVNTNGATAATDLVFTNWNGAAEVEVMRINGANARVGIGTTNPLAPLALSGVIGDKIFLYNSPINDNYGFGVANSELRIFAGGGDIINNHVSIGRGAAADGAFIEWARFGTTGFILGTGVNATTLTSTASVARAISFPNASGTLALTTDITGGTSAGSFTTLAASGATTLSSFGTAGVVHNAAGGLLSSSLIVNGDITNSTIDLAAKVTGILPIANGGTGSATVAGVNQFFANTTGGSAPAFRPIVAGDLPATTVTASPIGTANTIAKFTSASNIGNSLLTDNGTTLGYTFFTLSSGQIATLGASFTNISSNGRIVAITNNDASGGGGNSSGLNINMPNGPIATGTATGIIFNIASGVGTSYDMLGSGSTWSISNAGAITTTGNISLTGSNKTLSFKGNGVGTTTFTAGAQGATTIAYTLPIVAPTAGQVLSSTAGGVMSWASLSGGAGSFTTLTSTGASTIGTGAGLTNSFGDGGGATVNNIGTAGTTINNIGTGTGGTTNNIGTNSATASVNNIGGTTSITGTITIGGGTTLYAVQKGTSAAMVAGSVTVTPGVALTGNSIIVVTVKTPGGIQGFLNTGTRTGTSFTVASTSAFETSTIDWIVIN